jgi:hypothetical protein
MKRSHTLLLIAISLVCASTIDALYIKFTGAKQVIVSSAEQRIPVFAKYSAEPEQPAPIAADFTIAASLVVASVVHIKTKAVTYNSNKN